MLYRYPQINKIIAAHMKNIKATVNRLSSPGSANYKMALKMFIEIPLNPFPNITTAIYLKGKIPARPNIMLCKIPLKHPKIKSTKKHNQNFTFTLG